MHASGTGPLDSAAARDLIARLAATDTRTHAAAILTGAMTGLIELAKGAPGLDPAARPAVYAEGLAACAIVADRNLGTYHYLKTPAREDDLRLEQIPAIGPDATVLATATIDAAHKVHGSSLLPPCPRPHVHAADLAFLAGRLCPMPAEPLKNRPSRPLGRRQVGGRGKQPWRVAVRRDADGTYRIGGPALADGLRWELELEREPDRPLEMDLTDAQAEDLHDFLGKLLRIKRAGRGEHGRSGTVELQVPYTWKLQCRRTAQEPWTGWGLSYPPQEVTQVRDALAAMRQAARETDMQYRAIRHFPQPEPQVMDW